MSFYQNPFDTTFSQNWPLVATNFKCPANRNNKNVSVSWNTDTYDFSTLNTLTMYYARDIEFKHWQSLAINVAGATPSATTAAEVATILNADATFASYFTAVVKSSGQGQSSSQVQIKRKKDDIKIYFSNGGAETKLKFNKFAGVSDMPTYLDRHTIANRFTYDASEGVLVRLSHPITANTVANPTVVTSTAHGLSTNDVIYIVNSNSTPTIDGERTVTVTGDNSFTIPVNVTVVGTKGEWLSTIEKNVVADYGLDYTTMKEDYEHLGGNNQLYNFTKQTIDGSNRVTSSIKYASGSVVGSFCKKTLYTYTSANTYPDTITEIPYQLTASDLISPS